MLRIFIVLFKLKRIKLKLSILEMMLKFLRENWSASRINCQKQIS